MKKSARWFALAATAAIGFASIGMFTGCDTNHPEVRITYEFRGERYEVDYVLTRKGAPQTVRHFIELADAGYYTDTVIHDYQEDLFLYGGAYTLNEEGELEEKDYWSEMRRLEKEGNTFTQTVYASGADMSAYLGDLSSDNLSYTAGGETYDVSSEKIPLYTVYGEFADNGVKTNSEIYTHTKGCLAMFYSDKGNTSTRVTTVRADNGEEQKGSLYKFNSATSMFYTFTANGSRSDLNAKYTPFGKTIDFDQLQELIDAIKEYTDGLSAEEDEDGNPFVDVRSFVLNTYDPIDQARNSKVTAEYKVPVEPIYVRSVKVTKY